MKWGVLEHTYTEKSNDWIAAAVVITGVLAAAMLYYGNYLSVVLVVVGAFVFLLHAVRKPDMIEVEITVLGIRAGETFYPFSTLDAFEVIDHPVEHKIILESKRSYLPLHIIPVADDVDREELRELLADHLPHKEMYEPVAHRIMESLGF